MITIDVTLRRAFKVQSPGTVGMVTVLRQRLYLSGLLGRSAERIANRKWTLALPHPQVLCTAAHSSPRERSASKGIY